MPMPQDRRVKLDDLKADRRANGKTDGQLQAALAQVDQDALYDEELDALEVEEWDRVSPINGVPAAHFLNRPDVVHGHPVFLLIRDGRVVMFQPHAPGAEGITAMADPIAEGEEHARSVAADTARGRVFEQALGT